MFYILVRNKCSSFTKRKVIFSKLNLFGISSVDPLDGNIYALKCLIAHPILRNTYFVMFTENQEKVLTK